MSFCPLPAPRREAVGPRRVCEAEGPCGVGGLSLQGGWGLSPRGFIFFFFPLHFFFFSSRFYLEAAPGRPRRNVTHQPARRVFGPKARSNAAPSASSAPRTLPRTPPRPPRALRSPSTPWPSDRFQGGVQRKFVAAAGLPALGLGSSPPSPARSLGLARDLVLPRHRHHEQAIHWKPKRERDSRGLGESVCGAQDLLQRAVPGQVRLRLRRLPGRTLGNEGHRNFLG